MRKVADWILTIGLFWPLVGLSVVVILPLTIVEGVWMRQHCVVLQEGECETHASNGVREALAALAQAAQAAQDEKGVGDVHG